jgi:hypothetical protein
MIYIFHGDDQFASRTAFSNFLDQHKGSEILRLDSKNTGLDMVNNFINSQSLFGNSKILAISNFFTINKADLNKIIKIINDNDSVELAIWQNKVITPTQSKIFSNAQIRNFPVNKLLFSSLSQIRPKNLRNFIPSFKKVIKKEPFELYLYLIKNNLRKQLIGYSAFNKDLLKKTYLQLIEIDFKNKSGQLSIPKELAVEQALYELLK